MMSHSEKTTDLSVVICTRDRATSLAETLECLRRADRERVRVQIVVVDNGSTDDTKAVVASCDFSPPVQYLWEPCPGKAHAMNRALKGAQLGDVIAFLDDDMSPEPDWVLAVMSACKSWPQCDFFGGRTPVRWPPGPFPGWATSRRLRGWAYSSEDHGSRDLPFGPGEWPSPGNFWVRSRVFLDGRRFHPIWATEPRFLLELHADGFRGVRSGAAVAWHRVQPQLLEEEDIRQRAELVGRSLAAVLTRSANDTKQARLLRAYPAATSLFCVGKVGWWSFQWLLAHVLPSHDRRFERTVCALERLSYFTEILRTAWSRRRVKVDPTD